MQLFHCSITSSLMHSCHLYLIKNPERRHTRRSEEACFAAEAACGVAPPKASHLTESRKVTRFQPQAIHRARDNIFPRPTCIVTQHTSYERRSLTSTSLSYPEQCFPQVHGPNTVRMWCSSGKSESASCLRQDQQSSSQAYERRNAASAAKILSLLCQVIAAKLQDQKHLVNNELEWCGGTIRSCGSLMPKAGTAVVRPRLRPTQHCLGGPNTLFGMIVDRCTGARSEIFCQSRTRGF